ncbi:MAG: hypothetical protein L0332_29790 [Chloroflexi bacterium]|nr:hypothetical protein [Chloroflexota bacterium]MCI0579485.1 hypothetical protein [Chloroflexota bacterium]MCI0648062.1 hypothetical protein [Chloroflexota bacterium]MCI0730893.1 hypothetical protein [Chloroflexota bacterium]
MIVKIFTGAFVVAVVVLVGLGFFAGLSAAKTDVLNPWTSQAEAREQDMQTTVAAERNRIDLAQYAREQAAKTDAAITETNGRANAAIAEANAQVAYLTKRNELSLELQERVYLAAVLVSSALSLYAGVRGLNLLYAFLAAWQAASTATTARRSHPDQRIINRQWVQIQKARARQAELLYRQELLVRRQSPSFKGNGHHRQPHSSVPP